MVVFRHGNDFDAELSARQSDGIFGKRPRSDDDLEPEKHARAERTQPWGKVCGEGWTVRSSASTNTLLLHVQDLGKSCKRSV